MSRAGPQTCAAIVVAGGRGERLGGEVPKALVEVGGRPLVAHAVDRLHAAGLAPLVVVHPAEHRDAFAAALTDAASGVELRLVPGGVARSDSVRAGLAAVPAEVSHVAVHDAARGLQPSEVIATAVAAVAGEVVAAAPGVPVDDTLKQLAGTEIVATVDRSELVAIQTPQVFVRAVLVAAHAAGAAATDDLGLVERWLEGPGHGEGRAVCVPGSALGRKVTRHADIVLLESFLDG